LLAVAWLWRISKQQARGEVKPGSNPFELSEAIKFGLLFGVVVLAARAAQVYFGDAGVYLASAIAGLTDVDAITLAMADLARLDPASLPLGARAVVIAVLANTLTKSAMVLVLGSSELRRVMLPVTLGLLATGAVGLWLMF